MKFAHTKRLVTILAILLTTLLAGCESELYSSLSERQANQIVQALSEVGISASRNGTEPGKFSVSVERSNFSRAIAELSSRGLPREEHQSMGQVFAPGGVVTTPFEERARFMYALGQELSASISQIAGVASARVHIMVPESNPFNKEAANPRASVFIYTANGVDLSKDIPTIKNLVVNSVDNMKYENVEVAIFNGQSSSNSFSASLSGGLSNAGDIVGQVIVLLILGTLMFVGWRLLRSLDRKQKEKPRANVLKNRIDHLD